MRQFTVKPGNYDPRHNFNASPEISYWAKKYNTDPEKIREIFAASNFSISKTLAYLQDKLKVVA